jgi:sialate O-acetylesterase
MEEEILMRHLEMMVVPAAVSALFTFWCGAASADVSLPGIFADNMVIQRGMEVSVWGAAAPGEGVTVDFCGKTATASAGEDGRWMVKLGPFEAGGPHVMTVTGTNTLTFSNVLVGDVWLASGQSNMNMSVERSLNAEEEIAAADHPEIRLCTVKRATAVSPQTDCTCTWVECSPETVGSFSGVAYAFARDLQKEIGVPVGVIHSSWSGSVIEGWMSPEAINERGDELAELINRWEMKIAAEDPEKLEAEYQRRLARWREASEKAGAEGGRVPRKPWKRNPLKVHELRPSNLYNAMIAPIVPYGMKGVIWYQGEGNSSRAGQYRSLFPALIADWREHWGQGDFPFLFVQLANFRAQEPEPVDASWAELRQVQLETLRMPKTGMALAIDAGEADNLHPGDKWTVGRRLSLAARRVAYGEDIVFSGPIYDSMVIEDSKIVLKFKHIGSGLVSSDGEPLRHFAVAAKGGRFVWANAEIAGDTVVVWSDDVAEPAEVRYAWQSNPENVNFYNAEGLPASPFRTDERAFTGHDKWPGVLDH